MRGTVRMTSRSRPVRVSGVTAGVTMTTCIAVPAAKMTET